MPLPNRVDPFGAIHAVAARGLFTGNRGVIHDPTTRTLLKRRWTTKAWIICTCSYKNRPARDVMGYRPDGGVGWTELFFLDEVTALAAGHRPCCFCRREKAQEFADCFGMAFGISRPKVAEMDAKLHGERLASGGKPVAVSHEELSALPDGVMVAAGAAPFAIRDGALLGWSFEGYGAAAPLHKTALLSRFQLTPPTIAAVLRAGFRPTWHSTAATADHNSTAASQSEVSR